MKDGTQAGDMVIENQRLKTTLALFNSKIKINNDSEAISNAKINSLKATVESLTNKVKTLESDLDISENARRDL